MSFLEGFPKIGQILFMIPLLPGITAAILGINWMNGRRLSRTTTIVLSLGSVFASLLLSLSAVGALIGLAPEERHLTNTLWEWFAAGPLHVPFAFEVDPLSGVMILVVTGFGFLIHMYSVSYMGEDEGFQKFMAWLNLFMFAMLILVLGNNFLMMFIGWEGVGLCSFGLIGFWYKETPNANAAKKAFIVNRVGDFMFITGLLSLFWLTGSQTGFYSIVFREMADKVSLYAGLEHSGLRIAGLGVVTFATLCFFGGATGKSAQIPLFVWLPDAMAGPTPVSALIHAATMVTSGIYMVTRLNFLFQLAPLTLLVVAAIGTLTAVLAASIGLFQYDIKKVLAYSTVSQLGYMFIGLGTGAYAAGMFHVFTHAFFKACLFLGSGSVIHAMHGALPHGVDAQDMRNMGGLRKYMPITFITFALSVVAIAGIFPFAGFWSKDEILFRVFEHAYEGGQYAGFYWVFYVLGLVGAAMTAFYMTRQLVMTFFGEYRGRKAGEAYLLAHPHGHHDDGHHDHDDDHHDEEPHELHDPHESPGWITIPLLLLAGGSVFSGLLGLGNWAIHALGAIGVTASNRWEIWLEPVIRTVSEGAEHGAAVAEHAGPGVGLEFGLAVLSVAIAAASMFAAWKVFNPDPIAGEARFTAAVPAGFYKLAFEKYRIDEFYKATLVDGTTRLSAITAAFDTYVVDGLVNGIAYFVLIFRWVVGAFDRVVVDGVGVAGVGWIISRFGRAARNFQSGDLQQYLRLVAYGALACTVAYVYIAKGF